MVYSNPDSKVLRWSLNLVVMKGVRRFPRRFLEGIDRGGEVRVCFLVLQKVLDCLRHFAVLCLDRLPQQM